MNPHLPQSAPRRSGGPATLLAAALLTCAAAPSLAAPDVGVTVHVSQPGVYGRIDIGAVPPPPPALVYAQPIVVQPAPRAVVAAPPQPVYLWVPPGHQKHWAKHCERYNACGVPVYFVQDRWYREHVMAAPAAPAPVYRQPVYAPAPVRVYGPGPDYSPRHGYDGDRERERGHDGWKRDDDEREHGHGKGHGKGHGGGRD